MIVSGLFIKNEIKKSICFHSVLNKIYKAFTQKKSYGFKIYTIAN